MKVNPLDLDAAKRILRRVVEREEPVRRGVIFPEEEVAHEAPRRMDALEARIAELERRLLQDGVTGR